MNLLITLNNLTIERVLSLVLVLFYAPQLAVRAQPSAPLANWTIMVFMNGDNSLSDATGADFVEMAKVGSTDKIKIVTQIDRLGPPSQDENWGQTFRFYMTKGITDIPSEAVQSPVLGEQNMGSGKTLLDFVRWAKVKYPANHYMLIIWDHGQGWRLMLTEKKRAETLSLAPTIRTYAASMGTSHYSAYKSISNDETDKDELYNLEIQDALAELKNEKLDLLGFDACLMAMIETAYAFRDVAKVMVASQELIPNAGWGYDDWLAELMKRPSSSPQELATILVQSYKKFIINLTRQPPYRLLIWRVPRLQRWLLISSLKCLLTN